MDIINNFFTYLTDHRNRVSHKATMVISILILLVLTDNLIGFSFYYNNQNKIEQIKEITSLITDTTIEKNSKKELKQLRQDILNHKSIKDQLYVMLSNITFESEKAAGKPVISPPPAKYVTSEKPKTRNYYWHFVTSSWVWLILMICLPFAAITDKNQSLGQNLLLLLFVELLLWVLAWFHAKLFSYLPVILNEPIINYLINFFISFALVSYLYHKTKTKEI